MSYDVLLCLALCFYFYSLHVLCALVRRCEEFLDVDEYFLCQDICLCFIVLANSIYSRLSLSRTRGDPLKHFEISVIRHIRCAELRKISIEQPNFTKEHVI